MKAFISLIVSFSFVLFYGCKKNNLDAIAFPALKTNEYLFEEYNGDTELSLPASYSISSDKINEITLTSHSSENGEDYTIYAVYIGDLNTISNDTVIIYCHGQANNMDYYWSRAKLLAFTGGKHRFGVLMMDYRGYGKSEGEPTEKGLYEDVETACLWLKSKGVQNTQTILYGFSLGTVPATKIAADFTKFKPAKLILESPMASVDNLAQESTLINFSAKFLSTLEFNNAEKIKDVQQPYCWFHGKDDDYVAISNGEIIYQNYNGIYKEAHRISGAKHGKNGVPETMGLENYLQTVYKFIIK
jgi:alpha/beta superfamily hydrolase